MLTQIQARDDALRESEEKYRTMMEAMEDLVYICSSDYRIEYMNSAMIRQAGADVTGTICYQTLAHRDSPCPWCVVDVGEQTGEIREFEFTNPIDDRVYHVSSIPIIHADTTRSTMFILQDITERKCAEIERENLIAELEMKNTELEQFTHTVSHDLKSPLITIKSFLGLLKEDIHLNKHEEIEEDVKYIQDAADIMQHLLDDLLELSRNRSDRKPY